MLANGDITIGDSTPEVLDSASGMIGVKSCVSEVVGVGVDATAISGVLVDDGVEAEVGGSVTIGVGVITGSGFRTGLGLEGGGGLGIEIDDDVLVSEL
jgi:hypothetical protein